PRPSPAALEPLTPVTDLPRLRAFPLAPRERRARLSRQRTGSHPSLENRSNQGDEEDDQENKEQNARYASGSGGDADKAEHAGNQCNHTEDEGPIKHFGLLALRRDDGLVEAPNARLMTFVAAPQDPGGFASLEMSDRGEEVSAGERLLNQNCSAMRRRKLLPPIAADKGEGDAARLKRIGDASDRLAGEMGIQERAVDHLPVDGQKGISHTAGRADHGDACLLEHARDVERDQKFVFNYQHALCCHPCSRLFRQGQNRILWQLS